MYLLACGLHTYKLIKDPYENSYFPCLKISITAEATITME
jgi:hypothetical protein